MAISKKVQAKINKEQEKLNALVAKRDEFIEQTQAKISEMNAVIKEQEKVLAGVQEQARAEQLSELSSAVSKKGISLEALLSAFHNNDLYGIQELLEGKGEAPATDTVEDAEGSDSEEANDTADDETVDETENENSEENTVSPNSYYGG